MTKRQGAGLPSSHTCKYFGYEADTEENPSTHTDPSNPLRQREGTRRIWHLSEHLSDRHPELFREFKERQVSKCDYKHEHPPTNLYGSGSQTFYSPVPLQTFNLQLRTPPPPPPVEKTKVFLFTF